MMFVCNLAYNKIAFIVLFLFLSERKDVRSLQKVMSSKNQDSQTSALRALQYHPEMRVLCNLMVRWYLLILAAMACLLVIQEYCK